MNKLGTNALTNNMLRKAVIDGTAPKNINSELEQNLFTLFIATMRRIASIHAIEAKFNMSCFAAAKQLDCLGFTLAMKRMSPDNSDYWIGVFTRAEQSLKVIGHLEDYEA